MAAISFQTPPGACGTAIRCRKQRSAMKGTNGRRRVPTLAWPTDVGKSGGDVFLQQRRAAAAIAVQLESVVAEPLAGLADVTREFGHEAPEPGVVVHLAQMRDLMRHDIVEHELG